MGVFLTTPLANASPLTKFGRDTNSATFASSGTCATIAVAAGSCTTYVIVFVEFEASFWGALADKTIKIDIDTDTTNRVSRTVLASNGNTSALGPIVGGSYLFYYEPTASEKSSGFNVVVKANIAAAAGTANLFYKNSTVMGY